MRDIATTIGAGQDLLLTGCLRLLAGETQPVQTAVLCHEGMIAAAAPSPDEALAAARRDGHRIAPGTVVVNLGGALLLPGLHDCHVHLTATGLDLLAANLRGCRSVEDVWAALRAGDGAGLRQGPLLVGNGLNELNLAERRMPTLAELDHRFAGVPVLISRVDGHSCVVNSAAWKALGLPFSPDGPYPEGVEADPVTGKATGCLRATANATARRRREALLTGADRSRAVLAGAELAADAGCTTVHCLEGGGMGSIDDADAVLRLRDRLPVRTVVFAQTTDVSWAVERDLTQIGGCLLVDGSLGSHTAALRDAYADRPETSGVLYFSDDDLRHFLAEAEAAGLRVALHTIGDAAIEQALGAFEAVAAARPSPSFVAAAAAGAPLRADRAQRASMQHRLEHFSLPDNDQIRRAVALDLTLSVQPSWARADNPYPGQLGLLRLGPDRAQRLYPLATLLAAGAAVCGGSDSPVSPLDPISGIVGAVNNFHPEENVRLDEAISLFAINAAAAGGPDLPARGRIRGGFAADVTIVHMGDPKSNSEDGVMDPLNWRVLGTVVSGRLRCNALGRRLLSLSPGIV